MKCLKILIMMAVLCGRLYSCSHSEALCKTGPIRQEQRNKVACEDMLTDQELQGLRDLPDSVKVIIEKYAVEHWKDYSGILASKEEFFGPRWAMSERLVSLATWQKDKLFTIMPPIDPHAWSGFITYDGFPSNESHDKMSQGTLISAAALDKSGDVFITGDVFGEIASYNPRRGPLVNWKVSDKKITSIAVSYDNNYLLVVGANNRVYWFLLKEFSEFNRCSKKPDLTVDLLCRIFPGASIAFDRFYNLVVVRDYSDKKGKGAVKVSWWRLNQDIQRSCITKEFLMVEPGEVRSVVLNHAATRLAIVSDNKNEMQEKNCSTYRSYITLWDLVREKCLFAWEEVNAMKDPVSGIILRGDDSIVMQEPSGMFARIQGTKAHTYKERISRYREKHDLETITPRFVHPFLVKVDYSYSSPKSRD